MTPAYQLVPAIGSDAQDILRTFDGSTQEMQQDPEACRQSMVRAAKPVLAGRSNYEPLPTAETECLAMEAAAREGQRLGFQNLADILTTPDPRLQAQLEAHVASELAPGMAPNPGAAPTVRPGQRGPSGPR